MPSSTLYTLFFPSAMCLPESVACMHATKLTERHPEPENSAEMTPSDSGTKPWGGLDLVAKTEGGKPVLVENIMSF